jgi:hypothetical protein
MTPFTSTVGATGNPQEIRVAHIPPASIGTTNCERIIGHAPHILASWSALEDTFFNHSVLSKQLLDQVRRTLADSHGCESCQAKGRQEEHLAKIWHQAVS